MIQPQSRLGLWGAVMVSLFRGLWAEDQGQDIAEYAVMLGVILVIVVGTLRLIGSNPKTAFSRVAGSIQQQRESTRRSGLDPSLTVRCSRRSGGLNRWVSVQSRAKLQL